MYTEYKHFKLYSQMPFTSVRDVCKQIYPPLSVRQHLRTNKHKKCYRTRKWKMLRDSADKSIYRTSQTSKSTLRE